MHPALQDVDERPAAKAAAKLEAEMADRDLAKLIVLTPSCKNGLDGKSHNHGHHVGSALTEGLRLFDEVSSASGSSLVITQIARQHPIQCPFSLTTEGIQRWDMA